MTIPVCGRLPENGDSCLPCTPEEERRIISELTSKAESNSKDGNLYYVVSNRWYAGWQRYVGDVDAPFIDCSTDNGSQLVKKTFERPGPIDNSDIVLDVNNGGSDEFELRRALQEGHDYVLVPEEAWKKFVDWYKGGPPLPRKLITLGVSIKRFYVEVYPIHLKLLDPRDNSELIIKLSRKSTIHDLYERVCTLKGLEKEKVCIWDYFNKMKIELPPSNQTIEDAHLQMDQDILLEAKDNASAGLGADSAGKELVLVPVEPQSSSLTITGGPSLSNGQSPQYISSLYPESPLSSSLNYTNDGYNKFDSRKGEKSGLAGLQNLGNTCFMNSALQCLVHTPPLAAYFLSDYSHEINDRNPLGMQGQLAIAFGDLLRTMWSSGQTAAAPRAFKGKVSRFAPQFSGYNQHDSQELLAFLLDGLHEDLNRVKQKPYIEMKDSDGRLDTEYADECWRIHKARNDSIIVDTCQGQYKSTLVCPVCNKVSITFDPFMYLTLPLPSTVTRTMTITVFYGDRSSLPKSYKVMVPKHGSCRDLIQALSKECDLRNDESLLLAEVYKHKIFRYLEVPLEPLSSIKDHDCIVAYVVPKKRVGLKRIEIIHCLERSENLKIYDGKLLGTPLVTFLGEETVTVASVEATLKKQLAPFRKSTNDSLSKVHSDKESENHKEIGNDADATDDMMIDEETINISIDSTEEESEKMFSYQLLVADERSSSYKPVELEYVPKAGQCLRVMLDWTKQEYELYDFSLLEDLPAVHKFQLFAKSTRQDAISLFSCLEAFLKEEPLGPDDMWFCPRCKEHREATKKLDLWRLPEILVIHLKRFSYSRYVKNKLDNFVDFPIHDLDLSKYVNTNDASSISSVYELYAISNHYGGLGGGHYTAYAKLIDDNRWYHFDDSYVSPASEDAIKTSAAYVLFYKRVKRGADTGNSS